MVSSIERGTYDPIGSDLAPLKAADELCLEIDLMKSSQRGGGGGGGRGGGKERRGGDVVERVAD